MREALLFEVKEQFFAFPVTEVREVLRAALPMPLPRPPFGCLGLLDVRGEMVPVLDLAVILGLRRPLPLQAMSERLVMSHLLVLEREALPVALVVDRVLEVGLAEDAGEEARALAHSTLGKAAALVAGVVEAGTRRALLLRPEGLVTAGRMRVLARALSRPRAEAVP